MPIERKAHEPIVYRLYDYLKENHVSRAKTIKGRDLAAKFDTTERQLRDYIREIREDMQFDKIILPCNKGYYIPTEEEGTADIQRLFHHAFSELRVARASMTKASRNGQGKIKLGSYYKEFVEAFGE